jgi:hypothetical protein
MAAGSLVITETVGFVRPVYALIEDILGHCQSLLKLAWWGSSEHLWYLSQDPCNTKKVVQTEIIVNM